MPVDDPADDPSSVPGFAHLGLAGPLVAAAAQAGWQQPTAVQAAVLPLALQGRDGVAVAPTGSGKTAAFLLPLLQRLLAVPGLQAERPRLLRALVLAPTRELAAQILQQARQLAATALPGLKSVLAVGGLSINPQMLALRGGAHLLVCTPGRLLDLVEQRALRLDGVQALVLDEADRLLDLGFADELGRLLALLPAQRQTWLCSATWPEPVQALARQWLRDPQWVRLAAASGDAGPAAPAPAPDIAQRVIVVDSARRTPLLRHLISSQAWPRVLVFVATQYASAHVADKLLRAGLKAAALHGQLSSGGRSQALADLQAGRLQVLVATDLAARGLHIDGLAAVVNHDLPRSALDYTHRIGRTGRAGAQGVAVSFILADAPGSEGHFRLIEKRQQQRVPREVLPGFEPAQVLPAVAADPSGGVKGQRKSKKDKLREAAALAALSAAVPTRRR